LGRVDHQIKLRGFRIELGEIEAALVQHSDVRDAVVMLREDVPGNRRLVGYVVASETASRSDFDTGVLRKSLQERLPLYMVPAALVALEVLPLNPNGKIDREALPVPDGSHSSEGEGFVAPTTPLEVELAKIWCDLLELEEVGIHDNFFDLGGHSLLANQVIMLVSQTLQVEVPVPEFFKAPSINGLANAISEIFGGRETAEEIVRTLAGLEELSDAEIRDVLDG
jgi:acyl carrier protein